ncbi:MAG: hypothetical protein AAGA56_05745 [Myxococcota bacterium]
MRLFRLGICVAAAAALSACYSEETEPEPTLEDVVVSSAEDPLFFGSGDFEAAYVDCDEYAGVGPVPNFSGADALVPSDYTVIEPFPGNAILVAQAGSCADIEIEGFSFGPGIFAQIGISVVPPATPGSGDFYQLAYATTNPLLALKLRARGVNARFTPFMSYTIGNGELDIFVPRPAAFSFRLSGPITEPDPSGTPNPTTVFNYYAEGFRRFGNINQSNVVEGIIFGEGSGVTLTPLGHKIRDLTGDQPLGFPFFSAPEIFDRADLLVTTNVF